MKIPQSAITKSKALLDMEYRLPELSRELDVKQSKIQYWIQQGLPIRRDNRNHIFIHGLTACNWITTKHRASNEKRTLKPNEGFCFRCRKPVDLLNTSINHNETPSRIYGTCARCGGKVVKGTKNDQ